MKTTIHKIIASIILVIGGLETVAAQGTTSQVILGKILTESTYNGSKCTTLETHYDGLGRPIIQVAIEASPVKGGPSNRNKNIIEFTHYDCMGRNNAITYLPYADFTDYPVSHSRCKYDQISFYSSYYKFDHGSDPNSDDRGYAYSTTKYDTSPQNVILETSSPGAFHNADSPIGHPVILAKRLNRTSDWIKKYVIQNDSMLYLKSWYEPDLLTVEEQLVDQTSDVTVRSCTYKNIRGQIVATSVQANNDPPRITYFIYDEYYDDRLLCVVPPAVDVQIRPRDEACVWSKFRDQLRFLVYNERGDMIREYYPGRDHISYVYDKLHRVILSQDGNQRSANFWIYNRYDDLGRVHQIKQVRSSSDESTFRSWFKDTYGKGAEDLVDHTFSQHTLLAEYRYGGYEDYRTDFVDGVYIKQYTAFQIPSYLTARSVQNVFEPYDAKDNTGLKIYEKVVILPDTSTYIERAFYYDKDGRLIQTVEKNPQGGISYISNKYDFVGNLLTVHESRQLSDSATADVKVTNYTYDEQNRLLTESTRLNDSPEATVTYTYDQLGRSVKTVYGNNVLTNDYNFDISGNLTSQSNEVFTMYLYRECPSNPLATPNYVGMISEWQSQHKEPNFEARQSYRFSYTPFGEFKGAGLQAGPAEQDRYLEKGLSYDLNGNILTLQRTGSDGSLIADYTYRYKGNQLDSLIDGDAPARTFRYDANGNMIFDSQNNWNYRYNALNLLEQVSDNSFTPEVSYSYLFDGTKIRATTPEGHGYIYSGSLVYESSPLGQSLESTDFSAGRIIKTASGYDVRYYVWDYLSNIRSIVNSRGEVLECNNYYPFGERWESDWYPRTDNRYLFNGKESQEFAGLNVLDYGARMYDSKIGRWLVHDPLATKYYPLSSYTFCANNPINLIDRDGMELTQIVVPARVPETGKITTQTILVDSRIAVRFYDFIMAAYNKHGLVVTAHYRTEAKQHAMQVAYDKGKPYAYRPATVSGHSAGFALDMGVSHIGLSSGNYRSTQGRQLMRDLSAFAAEFGIKYGGNYETPDVVHFYAEETDYGYNSRQDAIDENRESYRRGNISYFIPPVTIKKPNIKIEAPIEFNPNPYDVIRAWLTINPDIQVTLLK